VPIADSDGELVQVIAPRPQTASSKRSKRASGPGPPIVNDQNGSQLRLETLRTNPRASGIGRRNQTGPSHVSGLPSVQAGSATRWRVLHHP